jgi:hypothetical protein
MPTDEQIQQAHTVTMTLEAIQHICFPEIDAGRGRHFCLPMIRAAIDELELQFRGSPENKIDTSKN